MTDLPAQLVSAATEAIAELHPLTHSNRLQAGGERQGREVDARAAVVATLVTLGTEYCNSFMAGMRMIKLAKRIEQGDEEN